MPISALLVAGVGYALVVLALRFGVVDLRRWRAHAAAFAIVAGLFVVTTVLMWLTIATESVAVFVATFVVALAEIVGTRLIFWKTGGPRLPETLRDAFVAIRKVSHHRPLSTTDRQVLNQLGGALDRWSTGSTAELAGLLREGIERRLGERTNETDAAAWERARRLIELYEGLPPK
jgi:hypothetical protein